MHIVNMLKKMVMHYSRYLPIFVLVKYLFLKLLKRKQFSEN